MAGGRARSHAQQPHRRRVRGRFRDRARPASRRSLPTVRDHAVGLHAGVPGRLRGRLLQHRHQGGRLLLGEGRDHLDGALRLPGRRHRPRDPARAGALGRRRPLVRDRTHRQRRLRHRAAGAAGRRRHQPGQAGGGAADRRPGQVQRHQRLRPGRRQPEHLPHQRAHRRPQPPRRDAVRAAADAAAALSGRPPRPPASGPAAAVPADGAGADTVAKRRTGRHRRPAGALTGDPAAAAEPAHAAAGAGGAGSRPGRALHRLRVRAHRHRQPHQHRRPRRRHPLRVLLAGAAGARPASAAGHGLQHLRRLLPVPDRQDRLRAAQLLGGDAGRDRRAGAGALPLLLRLGVRLRRAHPRHRERRGAAAGLRPGGGAGRHRRSQLLLPDDGVRLLLRAGADGGGGAALFAPAPVRTRAAPILTPGR